jgi:hypothetical protein
MTLRIDVYNNASVVYTYQTFLADVNVKNEGREHYQHISVHTSRPTVRATRLFVCLFTQRADKCVVSPSADAMNGTNFFHISV